MAAEMVTAMYDASLDQFKKHFWHKPNLWPHFSADGTWSDMYCFGTVQSQEKYNNADTYVDVNKQYDALGISIAYDNGPSYAIRSKRAEVALAGAAPGLEVSAAPEAAKKMVSASVAKEEAADFDKAVTQQGEMYVQGERVKKIGDDKEAANEGGVQIRKNFNETAFFFPHLHTDADGNIEFSFTMPEAVTQWKWMSLAHTKDLSLGYNEKTIVTQKDLMVQPNAPRFLREGDRMSFSTKIANLTNKEITGEVQLQLFDA
ncbi:MAG TPA: alpha-2-macroglobulin family protein, partial [Niastella sp.]